jgi:hypothetical protein
VRISNTDISRCLRPSRAYWLRVQDIVSHLIDAGKSRSIDLASSIHTHKRLTACRTQCARLGAPTATIVSSARREYSTCLRLQRKTVTYLPPSLHAAVSTKPQAQSASASSFFDIPEGDMHEMGSRQTRLTSASAVRAARTV